MDPPEFILSLFLILVTTYEYVTGIAQRTLSPQGDFIVKFRGMAGLQEPTRIKKLNDASVVLPTVSLHGLASLSSPCRDVLAPCQSKQMASCSSLVYMSPEEGLVFFFVLNSSPWKGGLAELGLGGYLEPREWHEVAGTWLLPLKLCVIGVEGQFLERDGYFLSPLTFPGPLSPEVFDLETLYTPISFVQLFPHLSAGLPRPSR